MRSMFCSMLCLDSSGVKINSANYKQLYIHPYVVAVASVSDAGGPGNRAVH